MTQTLAGPVVPPIDTKARILDVAERLFAQQGFAATSLRQITGEAKVNLAAINYHFQSKESLIRAVLMRKIGPVNERRLELLDEAESAAGQLELECVIRAFFQPLLEAEQRGVDLASFPRLLARVYSDEHDLVPSFRATFEEVITRFQRALEKALPGLEADDTALAMHFSIGSMAHLLGANRMLEMLNGGRPSRYTRAELLESLVRFSSGGMRSLHAARRKQ